jgi:hypothetical protein
MFLKPCHKCGFTSFVVNYVAHSIDCFYRGRKQSTATEDFDVHISYFIIIIGGILVLFIYLTRLGLNEIFSPSNKIHWKVGRAKDLLAPL